MYATSLQYKLFTRANAHMLRKAHSPLKGIVYSINNNNRQVPSEPPHTPVYIHWNIGNYENLHALCCPHVALAY